MIRLEDLFDLEGITMHSLTPKQNQTNEPIRKAKRIAGITNWQIADLLGVSESTFTNRMRHELPEAEQNRIISLIKTWAAENR